MKLLISLLFKLSSKQQKWALFRSIRISSAHRRTRALRLICSCPYSLTSINHTWWLKPYPAIQAWLFRLKFDAVKGTPSSTGHSGDQPPRCLWCQSNIKHAEIKRSAADPAAQLQDDQHETKATTKMCNYVHSLQLTWRKFTNKLIGNFRCNAIINNQGCWHTLSSSSFCWIWQLN